MDDPVVGELYQHTGENEWGLVGRVLAVVGQGVRLEFPQRGPDGKVVCFMTVTIDSDVFALAWVPLLQPLVICRPDQ